jgi:hypothetical protein
MTVTKVAVTFRRKLSYPHLISNEKWINMFRRMVKGIKKSKFCPQWN